MSWGAAAGERLGFIDRNGNRVEVAHTYDDLGPLRVGLAKACRQRLRLGFIDRQGRFAIEPRFDEVRDFHEGFAAVGVRVTAFVPPATSKSGRSEFDSKELWGFVRRDGSYLVPPRFSEARNVAGARASVVVEVCEIGMEREHVATWKAAEPLAARAELAVDVALLRLFSTAAHHVPCAWLLGFLIRSADPSLPPEGYFAQQSAIRRTRALLEGARAESLDGAERAGVTRLRAALEEAIEGCDPTTEDEKVAEGYDPMPMVDDDPADLWHMDIWSLLSTLRRLDGAMEDGFGSPP